jgi:hypothetical protein
METFPSVAVAGLVLATPIAMALCLHTLLRRRALIFGFAGASPATTAQVWFKSTGNRCRWAKSETSDFAAPRRIVASHSPGYVLRLASHARLRHRARNLLSDHYNTS